MKRIFTLFICIFLTTVAFAEKPDLNSMKGKFQVVDSFPDYKIQFVDSFPDFTIQWVDSFPGPG